MKKFLAILLAALLMLSAVPALALNYSGDWGNDATFETYTEVRENGPAEMKELNPNGNYIAHPAMDGMNGDCVYVYRSANYYGRTAAVRINTNIFPAPQNPNHLFPNRFPLLSKNHAWISREAPLSKTG